MEFHITDARKEETDSFLAIPYLSTDGDFAYVVYQINARPDSRKGAELFRVSNGQFQSLAQYIVEENSSFLAISAGSATQDFKRFSIVEDNQNGLFRVRLLEYNGTNNFVVIGERTFSAITNGYTPYNGIFLKDDSALVVTAVTADTRPNQTSTLWLLANNASLSTLQTLVDTVIYPTLAAPFTAHNREYFAITTSHGVLDFNNTPAFWRPEHSLKVFRVSNGGLTLQGTAPLPQGGYALSVREGKCAILISVGTYTALPTNDDNTIIIRNAENTATNNLDNSELRFYNFCPRELKLRSTENTNTTVDGVLVSDKYVIVAQNIGPYSSFLPSTFAITERGTDRLIVSSPCNNSPIFVTDNTRYLLAAASDPNGFNNNLILFRIG